MDGEGRGRGKGEKNLHYPTPILLLSFDRWPPPLVQIYFSPQPSAAIKFKDGGHNFRKEITEHPFAKITPALWANNKKEPDKLQDGSNSVGFREKLP